MAASGTRALIFSLRGATQHSLLSPLMSSLSLDPLTLPSPFEHTLFENRTDIFDASEQHKQLSQSLSELHTIAEDIVTIKTKLNQAKHSFDKIQKEINSSEFMLGCLSDEIQIGVELDIKMYQEKIEQLEKECGLKEKELHNKLALDPCLKEMATQELSKQHAALKAQLSELLTSYQKALHFEENNRNDIASRKKIIEVLKINLIDLLNQCQYHSETLSQLELKESSILKKINLIYKNIEYTERSNSWILKANQNIETFNTLFKELQNVFAEKSFISWLKEKHSPLQKLHHHCDKQFSKSLNEVIQNIERMLDMLVALKNESTKLINEYRQSMDTTDSVSGNLKAILININDQVTKLDFYPKIVNQLINLFFQDSNTESSRAHNNPGPGLLEPSKEEEIKSKLENENSLTGEEKAILQSLRQQYNLSNIQKSLHPFTEIFNQIKTLAKQKMGGI